MAFLPFLVFTHRKYTRIGYAKLCGDFIYSLCIWICLVLNEVSNGWNYEETVNGIGHI
jgi:hypothetical protein